METSSLKVKISDPESRSGPISGFKGFHYGMRCLNKVYKVGETFTENIVCLCRSGIHYCENMLSVFNFYSPPMSMYARVTDVGDERKCDRNKNATNALTVEKLLTYEEMAEAVTEQARESGKLRTTEVYDIDVLRNGNNPPAIYTDINGGVAETTTSHTAAIAGVFETAAVIKKNGCLAYASGASSMAISLDESRYSHNTAVVTKRDNSLAYTRTSSSVAVAFGGYSLSEVKGENSVAFTDGVFSMAKASHSGSLAISMNSGVASAAAEGAVAIAINRYAQAKGVLGSFLVFGHYQLNKEDPYLNPVRLRPIAQSDWDFIGVVALKVDGKEVKPNVLYRYTEDGLTEVSNEDDHKFL